MNLKMKFAIAAVTLGCSAAVIAQSNSKTPLNKEPTPKEIGEGMATCSALISFSDNKKLIDYPKSKVDASLQFFREEGEKRIGDNFLVHSLQKTFKISEAYADSKNAEVMTELLVSTRIIGATGKCMESYERSLK